MARLTEVGMALILTSTAFSDGAVIPIKHTCKGPDVSPALAWSGAPEGTKSLVLIVDDPDAPDPKAPRRVWTHWVVYNISPAVASVPEGAKRADFGAEAQFGLNDWSRAGYNGPCPPVGQHRYFHKLYALDTVITGLNKPTKKQVEAAMAGHTLAKVELIGLHP
jgi:Raf kinase inhibitor-like YbhB/YbcL family protein